MLPTYALYTDAVTVAAARFNPGRWAVSWYDTNARHANENHPDGWPVDNGPEAA